MDRNYVLFLFKTYDFERGIVSICERNPELTVELLNFYMKKNGKESPRKIYEACSNHLDNAELWIKALTYLREVDTDDGET